MMYNRLKDIQFNRCKNKVRWTVEFSQIVSRGFLKPSTLIQVKTILNLDQNYSKRNEKSEKLFPFEIIKQN